MQKGSHRTVPKRQFVVETDDGINPGGPVGGAGSHIQLALYVCRTARIGLRAPDCGCLTPREPPIWTTIPAILELKCKAVEPS